ncbi:S-layer homology domain-containing protein (plasmid) [Sporosarcina psychrophila]|uniref:S-layer homology domain-containing protein n=1 Tax=Sporosarcina psychrophila TaxID=1476 RepID=UPI0030D07C13
MKNKLFLATLASAVAIISGYENGTFRANESISRKHAAALVSPQWFQPFKRTRLYKHHLRILRKVVRTTTSFMICETKGGAAK